MNLAFRQIPMLKSFIATPAVHENASRNPTLLGGAFLDLRQRDLGAVRLLLQETLRRGAPLIEFAEGLLKLDRQLLKTETGHSLDHVYNQLPDCLAGVVEVNYDLANHPTVRVFEEMLGQDGLKMSADQQLSFNRIQDKERSFFLTTPRLDSPDRHTLSIPFADERIEWISASRTKPTPFQMLADALGAEGDERARLRSFFTTDPPCRNEPNYAGDDVRVRYFGHACVLVQSKQVCVLIDPFVTWDRDNQEATLTFDDLPNKIDYVFLTHNHQDHFCPEVLLQLRGRIGEILVPRNNSYNLADPSMRLALRNLGFFNVRVMDPLDTVEIPEGCIGSLPFYGEHADLSIASKHAMYIKLKGRSFLFVADSDSKDRHLYRRIAARIGRIDTLFVGMECHGAPLTWLYGTYLSHPMNRKDDDSRRLSGSDATRAWTIVEEMGCKTAYIYALGQEPWLRYVAGLSYTPESRQILEANKFVAQCLNAGVHSERLHGCRTMQF
jgi:L-ascorbate metabolism protein UlaG (beta-lactamase superfamily)